MLARAGGFDQAPGLEMVVTNLDIGEDTAVRRPQVPQGDSVKDVDRKMGKQANIDGLGAWV